MNKKQTIANSILWAAAIVAAAILRAPTILTTILLPALWSGSLLLGNTGAGCSRAERD